MKKNVASQLVSAQMLLATDGSDVTTGTCNVAVEIDGTPGTGGTATHIANGKWEYAPIQADTNGDYLTFQFVLATAITVTVQVYTSFPQTVDNNVLAAGATGFAAIDTAVDTLTTTVGAAVGADISADIAAVKADSAAVKLQTDKLAFTVTNRVDSQVLGIVAETLGGTGVSGDEFDVV